MEWKDLVVPCLVLKEESTRNKTASDSHWHDRSVKPKAKMTDQADPASLLLSLSPAFQISIAMKEHLYLDLSTRAAYRWSKTFGPCPLTEKRNEDWACERIVPYSLLMTVAQNKFLF